MSITTTMVQDILVSAVLVQGPRAFGSSSAEVIVAEWLHDHNLDGLFYPEGPCGCGKGELAPCGNMSNECEVARKRAAQEGDTDADGLWVDELFLPAEDLAQGCAKGGE